MNKLGPRLKAAREKIRLTQQEAAAKLGISNGTLSGYERNYRDPDTDTLRKLADLYQVSVDWLTGITNDPSAKPNKVFYEPLLSPEDSRILDELGKLAPEDKKYVYELIKRISKK